MASIREALSAALDGDTLETVEAPTEVVETTPEVVETAPDTVETVPTEKADASVRDALGRFVPKIVGEGATVAPAVLPVGTAPNATAPPTQLGADGGAASPPPAPVSWKPEVKAEWGKLSPSVQAEVMRREAEVQRVLNDSGSARSIANQFSERVTPYMPFIRAEGLNNPLDAFVGLMDTHVALKTGSAFQKAEKLASLVEYYGVDIQELDKALAGVAQEKPEDVIQRQVQELVQQQLAPVMQLKQQLEAQQQQTMAAEVQNIDREMTEFAQKNPHFNTVRTMMADVLELAERSGEGILSMQEAYNRATALHPSLRGVTLAAQTAQTAQQMNAAAQRAKAAARAGRVPMQASSVAQGSGRTLSLRETIGQAMQNVPLA